MRVAALYDVHGNLPALEAVLEEVARERFDAVVVGGDLFWGPWPAEVVARVRALPGRVELVRGNCDRETFERDPASPHGEANAWVAARLGAEVEAFVATWQPTVTLSVDGVGEVCFCHATLASDTDIVTPRTPPGELEAAFAEAGAAVVVCGHTHVQFDLPVGAKRVVNAGSVGWAYEGAPGAYWLELGPTIRHRRTQYDHAAAAAALGEVRWPGPLEPSDLVTPATAEEAIAVFEAQRVAAHGRTR